MNESPGRTPLRTELRWLLVIAFWMALPVGIAFLWFLSQLRKL